MVLCVKQILNMFYPAVCAGPYLRRWKMERDGTVNKEQVWRMTRARTEHEGVKRNNREQKREKTKVIVLRERERKRERKHFYQLMQQ